MAQGALIYNSKLEELPWSLTAQIPSDLAMGSLNLLKTQLTHRLCLQSLPAAERTTLPIISYREHDWPTPWNCTRVETIPSLSGPGSFVYCATAASFWMSEARSVRETLNHSVGSGFPSWL